MGRQYESDPSHLRQYSHSILRRELESHFRAIEIHPVSGHLLGGAGGLEAGIAVLAIRDQIAPPTINHETPDPACDLDYVPNVARPMKINVAMSNSFGFGGTNGGLIFRKYDE